MAVLRSLAVKLTLAFLLVGLTGSILVAVIIQQRTRVAFNTFIMNQEQQTLADNLVVYYQTKGSWTGVGNEVLTLQTTMPQPPRGGPDTRQGRAPFTLVGPDQIVVYSNQPNEIGDKLTKNQLTGAINLQSNGQSIGWLVLAPATRNFNPNTPEGNFLRNVNSATLLSAIVAILLAFALGGLLAFTMTRSLRELTEATIEIAKGRFGKQVKVRSKDEIGNLAVSFNQMSSDLERATRARQQMTADIAHDLRSPLSVITGYAEALSDNKLQGTPEVYTILLQETKHLDRLVDDLRLLSLADTGELSLSLQSTALKALLERVAARHIVAAQQSKVSLIVDANDELPHIHVDIERMSQVLDNLILNAFRYTSEGGEIYLDAAMEDRQVKIIVRDNGQGISPEDLPHIFDRFYRGDKSRTNNGESGLGLAIAKSIVEAHGGRINVESILGKGAAFTIYLDPYIPDLKSTQ
jgi:signal transduction histidine kinase